MFFSDERRAASVVLIGCALIAGCGGGGGGGSTPQNRAPTLGTVQFSGTEDTDVSAQVTATDPDGDALTFTRTGDPAKGSVTAFAANGSFTYRPYRDAFGSDTFAVRVTDPQGGAINGTVTIQLAGTPDPPAAQNDLLIATTASLANLNVLANDADPDGDMLTVTLESPAEVGTATVNAGGSIAISGLPAGFRGITRFKYRLADPGIATGLGTAVVFVDVAPFRVIFAADEPGQDSPEVYLTDLASAQVQLTAASEGNLRLRSFAASDNGSTVVYRRRDQSQGNAPVDLSFVRAANPATAIPIQFPAGMQLQAQVSSQLDTYVVSPDGQWIAGIVSKDQPGTFAVVLVNVDSPAVIHTPSLADTAAAENLQFSSDSQHLYFLSGGPSNGNQFALYRAAVATPDQSELMSTAAPPAQITDRVANYWISPDQSKIVLFARRAGAIGLHYVSAANPRNEIRLNDALDADDEMLSSVARFGAATSRVAYTVSIDGTQTPQSFVAEISATPNPRPLAPDGLVTHDIRPDLQAVLLTGTLSIVEQVIDSAQAPTLVGDTEDYFNLRYDARGDAILSQVVHDIPPSTFYLTQAAAVRPTFGTTQQIGTPGKASLFANFTGAGRAISFIGEGPQVQPVPPVQTFRIALANAWTPDKLVYVTDLVTPRSFLSSRVRVVDP